MTIDRSALTSHSTELVSMLQDKQTYRDLRTLETQVGGGRYLTHEADDLRWDCAGDM